MDTDDDSKRPLAAALLSHDNAAANSYTLPPPANNSAFQILSNENQIDADAEFARNHLYNALDHARTALTELATVSRETFSPRSYEVLAGLVKTIGETSEKLLALHKDKKELALNNPNNKMGMDPDDKAVFIGTPNELLRAIRRGSRDVVDGEIIEHE